MNTVYPLKTLNQLRPVLVGFRKAKGLTQKQVSGMLGVTQQTYARLESNPGSASMERLFNVLGVEIVLSSEFSSSNNETEDVSTNHSDSPARREQW
jgi:HTH-type transcriptional regulator/antitoxin HipB